MPYSSWAEAFFAQAQQDFLLAYLGLKDETKYCASSYMLLQMFFEKYAKAVYCHSKKQLPPRTHCTARVFASTLKRSPKYLKLLKKRSDSSASKPYLDFFDFCILVHNNYYFYFYYLNHFHILHRILVLQYLEKYHSFQN